MFEGLEPGATVAAFDRLKRGCESVRLLTGEGMLSLCELWHHRVEADVRLAAGDIDWLDGWARNLRAPVNPERFTMVAGLFLLRAAERNWRRGVSGEIWPESASDYPHETASALFLPARNCPTTELAEAIRRAVQTLGLRNGLEIDAAQKWYRTVVLQYGMPMSYHERIPYLLAGESTDLGSRIVRMLRSGHQSSKSFKRLMRVLADFRRGTIHREEAARNLQQNPWVPAGSLDRLLSLSLGDRHIPVADDDGARDFSLSSLIGDPCLDFPPEGPRFLAQPKDLVPADLAAEMELSDPTVMVFSGDQEILRFLRDRDGSYRPAVPGGVVVLPVRGPELEFRLQNRQGVVSHAGFHPVYCEDGDIAWFAPSGANGRWRSTERRRQGRPNVLRLPPRWTLPGGQFLGSGPCGGGYWRADGDGSLAVLDDNGETAWEGGEEAGANFLDGASISLAVLNAPPKPGYAGLLKTGDPFRWKLQNLAGNADLVRADWEPSGTGELNPSGVIRLEPRHISEKLAARCTLARTIGSRVRRRTIRLSPAQGAGLMLQGALRRDEDWVEVDAAAEVHVRDAARKEYLLAVGESLTTREACGPIRIREGGSPPRKWPSRRGHFSGLQGFGEPVKACRDDHELLVFSSCHDGGAVSSAGLLDGTLLVSLMHQVDLTPEHKLVTWDPDGGVRFWTIDSLGSNIAVSARIGDHPIRCAGIAYRGHCLGWGAVGGIQQMLLSLANVMLTMDAASAMKAVAASKWFGWPMLRDMDCLREKLVEGATRNGLSFHQAWLGNEGLAVDGLICGDTTLAHDRRWDVTRILAGGWRPASPGEAVQLSSLVLQDDLSQIAKPSDQWALHLFLWNPALAARVVDLLMPRLASREARGAWIGPCLLRLDAIGQSGKRDTDDLIGRLRAWRDTVPPRTMASFIP